MELPYIAFDASVIRVKNLYKNDASMAEIRAQSTDAVPQKVLDVYGEVCFPQGHPHRPYTYASLVLSSDGKMAYPSCPQGPVIASANQLDPDCGKTDFWVLNMLRTYADAVIIGARTLQTEAEATAHVFDPDLAQARVNVMKKRLHPINLVVSLDGSDVPLEHRIFTSRGLVTAIATGRAGGALLAEKLRASGRDFQVYGHYKTAEEAPAAVLLEQMERPERIHILSAGAGELPDSGVLLQILRNMGIHRVMVESPSYIWHLLKIKSLDELFINYSMVFCGGDITLGLHQPFTHDSHPHSELLMLGMHRANLICTRQRLHYEFSD